MALFHGWLLLVCLSCCHHYQLSGALTFRSSLFSTKFRFMFSWFVDIVC